MQQSCLLLTIPDHLTLFLMCTSIFVLQAMFGNMMMNSLGSYEGFSQAAENVSGGREDWGYMQKIAAVFG